MSIYQFPPRAFRFTEAKLQYLLKISTGRTCGDFVERMLVSTTNRELIVLINAAGTAIVGAPEPRESGIFSDLGT